MNPVLSILIPTVESNRNGLDRTELLNRLMDCLRPQLSDAVVVRKLVDDGRLLVGQKRQQLLVESNTPWVTFIDDDDLVAANYCESVLSAINTGADVVGFRVRHFIDGALVGLGTISVRYDHWRTTKPDDLYLYERMPNHLSPIRRELALSVGYKPLSSGEDADYSRRLHATHRLKEHFVDEELYDYLYRTRPPLHPEPAYDQSGRLTRAGAEQAILAGGSATWEGRLCSRIDQLD